MEREMKFETEVETQVENAVEQNTGDHKEKEEQKILIVYEYSRFEKYIDMSAAFALGLVSYEYFTTNSGFLYEVTDAMISEWEKMGIKIQYHRATYKEQTHSLTPASTDSQIDYLEKLKEEIQNNSDINITNNADDMIIDDDLNIFKKR